MQVHGQYRLTTISPKRSGKYGNYKFKSIGNITGFTIDKAPLTVGADFDNHTYDGGTRVAHKNVSVTGWIVSDSGFSKTLQDAFVGNLLTDSASKNVGTHAVSYSGLTLKTDAGSYGNYRLVYDDKKRVTIDPAELTVSVTLAPKTYDGTRDVGIASTTITGWVGTEKYKNNLDNSGGEEDLASTLLSGSSLDSDSR